MKLKTSFGMVVSGHKEATKAGIKILKNAVDLSMYGFAGSGGVIEIKTK